MTTIEVNSRVSARLDQLQQAFHVDSMSDVISTLIDYFDGDNPIENKEES